jgi:uncharacterized protein YuzE
MEIAHDEEADAIYITLREGDFARNQKINDTTILDLDAQGNVLGIEMLDVSKKFDLNQLKVSVKNLKIEKL